MAIETSEISDGILVRRHLSGEHQAFEELFERYYSRLVRLCVRRIRDRSASEDIAQETLVQAIRYLDRFDEKRPMWPWLKTIATHLIGRFLKARFEEESLNLTWLDTSRESKDEAELLCEKDLLTAALSVLTPTQRLAISLRYLDEWSAQEVADFLGTGKHAVEQLLVRARAKLRQEYDRLSEEARERLGLFFPGGLGGLRNWFRHCRTLLRNEKELMGAALPAAPAITPLIGLLAVGVAIGLLAVGIINAPKASGDSVPRELQNQIGSSDADIHEAEGLASQRTSRQTYLGTQQIAQGTPASASGSVDLTKNSFNAKLRAKLPGNNTIDSSTWIETDAECDYSAVQQALCDTIDLLPDQD